MDSNSLTYEIIDHTADLGILVKAKDVKSLFIRAAPVSYTHLTLPTSDLV